MQCAVLGPLEVRGRGDTVVVVPGAKERRLLAVLAAAFPASVSVDRLLESPVGRCSAPDRPQVAAGPRGPVAHRAGARSTRRARPDGTWSAGTTDTRSRWSASQLDATALRRPRAPGAGRCCRPATRAAGRRAAATGARPLARPPVRRLAGRARPRRRAGAAGGDPRPTAWRRSGRRSSRSAATPRRCPSSAGWSASSPLHESVVGAAGAGAVPLAGGRPTHSSRSAARAACWTTSSASSPAPAARAGEGDPGPGPRPRPRRADRGSPSRSRPHGRSHRMSLQGARPLRGQPTQRCSADATGWCAHW